METSWANKFWARVDIGTKEECWQWTGPRHTITGRGLFSGPEKLVQAHRFAYELWAGPIPLGMLVLHTCDNGAGGCVNPHHLYVGTQADNMRDRKERSGPYVNGRKKRPKEKLTTDEVREIRRLVASGVPRSVAGRQFGVTRWTASAIASGRSRRNVV
jgi:hypothetical protein